MLNQMRKMGMTQPFLCSDRRIQEDFIRRAGSNAEGVICSLPWNPDRRDAKLDAFRETFRRRFGEEPETHAAHAYDGMDMLIWAIQVAGLNRAKIRDVIAHLPNPGRASTASLARIPCGGTCGRRHLALPAMNMPSSQTGSSHPQEQWGVKRGLR